MEFQRLDDFVGHQHRRAHNGCCPHTPQCAADAEKCHVDREPSGMGSSSSVKFRDISYWVQLAPRARLRGQLAELREGWV